MDEFPPFEEAARYLDGAVFVLRKGRNDRHHLEWMAGSLDLLPHDGALSSHSRFKHLFSTLPARTVSVLLRALRRLWRIRGEVHRSFEIVADGRRVSIELRANIASRRNGVFMTGYLRDLTEIVESKAGRQMGATLEAAIRLFPDMVWLKDTDGRYVLCNEMFERFNGMPSAQLIGKLAAVTSEGQVAKIHEETDRQAMLSQEIVTFEHVVGKAPAAQRFFDVRKLALRDALGNAIGVLGTARETTEWRRLECEIRQSEQAYRSLADNIPDRLVRLGHDGVFMEMNRSMRPFFQDVAYPLDGAETDAKEFPEPNFTASKDIQRIVDAVRRNGEASSQELQFLDQNGATISHELRFVPELGEDGRVNSVLIIGRDITARKQMEQRLAEKEAELQALAFRDSLTGLNNRHSFQLLLEGVLERSQASKSSDALLLLDIDRFKYVNDTLGHVAGDDLIREFGNRLVGAVSGRGHVCRLGGDEFAIILPELASPSIAREVAEEVHRALHAPIRFGSNTIAITTSIGLAFADGCADDQTALFRFADMALYAAKADGRARTTIYDSSMAQRATQRFKLEALISEGIRNDEFAAYFQTKTDLATGRVNGMEALCRWIRPDGQVISPADFIPVSEETGQIVEIGRRILREACAFAVRINANRSDPMAVSVNVSARQLAFGGFLGALGACLEETGCKSSWIELELTESLLLGDDSNISETLEAIVRLGVALTVDDFGTGYSSLSYLARFPITTLKIDQSFVLDLETNSKNEILCRAIISMAHGLGLKTVAEGIETAEVAERLHRLGCDSGQGYFWSRPEPGAVILEKMSAKHGSTIKGMAGVA